MKYSAHTCKRHGSSLSYVAVCLDHVFWNQCIHTLHCRGNNTHVPYSSFVIKKVNSCHALERTLQNACKEKDLVYGMTETDSFTNWFGA